MGTGTSARSRGTCPHGLREPSSFNVNILASPSEITAIFPLKKIQLE